MSYRKTRILILCKTYPSPSARHAETSCVAGLEENGSLIRLYPVPFRLIGDKAQFKKWQWITARVEKSPNDHRPESHRIAVDTIVCDDAPLPTTNSWKARRIWLDKIPVFDSYAGLEEARANRGLTLGILRPSAILALDITPADRPDWTPEEREKLLQLQRQASLFDETDTASIATLRKLPFDFHYRYACGSTKHRHKIVDWEAGALYWNVRKRPGPEWREKLRSKLERNISQNDLMFLMGTIHRFPDQWLIASLIYPPKLLADQSSQGHLL